MLLGTFFLFFECQWQLPHRETPLHDRSSFQIVAVVTITIQLPKPLFSLCLQYQHAETPRIPKQGGSAGPASGSSALWKLWVHHGLNILVFQLLFGSPGSLVLLLNKYRKSLFISILFLSLEKHKGVTKQIPQVLHIHAIKLLFGKKKNSSFYYLFFHLRKIMFNLVLRDTCLLKK